MPIIDVSPLLDPAVNGDDVAHVATELDVACRDTGFFGIVGHGVDLALQAELERRSREFFALGDDAKSAIAMPLAGAAWRGWFPVGGELTSGRPDRKEGVYFGAEHSPDHPQVQNGTALHGANQFPAEPHELRTIVLQWLDEMRRVADAVMRGLALALGLPADWFAEHLTGDPTVLFRIFHYPPAPSDRDEDDWGVAEHTDYGLLTVLAQDDLGGLQVHRRDGTWIDVEARPGVFVCNLGDMLERLTGGRYVSTPHRVRNTATRGRLSFPYFFDPSWGATVPTLPLAAEPSAADRQRWDGEDVTAWTGTYGEYLTTRVARVFPDLFAETTGPKNS